MILVHSKILRSDNFVRFYVFQLEWLSVFILCIAMCALMWFETKCQQLQWNSGAYTCMQFVCVRNDFECEFECDKNGSA